MYSVLLAINIVAVVVFGKINVFQNQSIELSLDEIAFFETPNYPLLHDSSVFLHYNVTFFTNEISDNGTRCVLVLQGLSYTPTPFKNIKEILVFNVTSFYLETAKYADQFYDAFNGYIYFENNDDKCPFEDQSRNQPYNFTDESEIIFIGSYYRNATTYGVIPIKANTTKSCLWQFSAPKGYGFKIVILSFEIFKSQHFTIFNSTNMFVNERSVKLNHPYYNVDNYIQINLSQGNSSAVMEFDAYISIVKQNVPQISNGCAVVVGDGNFTWSTRNLTNGYENNVICNFNVTVESGTSIMANIDQMSIEDDVDQLRYYYDLYNLPLHIHDRIILRAHENGSAKTYYFVFESDGNYRASGFSISFVKNACQCADPFIPCDNITHTVMKNSEYVCQNVQCSFRMQHCSSRFTYLNIKASNYTDIDDIKVFSNGIVVYDSKFAVFDSNIEVYLKTENENLLEINSVSRRQKITTFKATPFLLPTPEINVILNLTASSYVLDETNTRFAVIQIDEKLKSRNLSINVYGVNLDVCNKRYFGNKSMNEEIFLKNCKLSKFYKCESTAQKLALYSNEVTYPNRRLNGCPTAFTLSSNTDNCRFNNTVYFLEGEKSIVSAMSTATGECVITLLNALDNFYSAINIFTTAKNENVKIFFGSNQKTLFLEFNSKTAEEWTDVKFLSDVYIVKIPRAAVVMLTFKSVKLPIVEKISEISFKTLLTTLQFGMTKCYAFYSGAFMTYFSNNVTLKFTVLEMKPDNVLYFRTESVQMSANKTGDVFISKNETVSLFSKNKPNGFCGGYVLVESVKMGSEETNFK